MFIEVPTEVAKEIAKEVVKEGIKETTEKIAEETAKHSESVLDFLEKPIQNAETKNIETNTANIMETDGKEGIFRGGRYGDIPTQEGIQRHHIPADTISPLEKNDGPCIQMETKDHRQTGSCGSSKEAIEYRNKQKQLIEAGNFSEAFDMDIEDIQSKFEDKYDEAIKDAREYLEKLEAEGKI